MVSYIICTVLKCMESVIESIKFNHLSIGLSLSGVDELYPPVYHSVSVLYVPLQEVVLLELLHSH